MFSPSSVSHARFGAALVGAAGAPSLNDAFNPGGLTRPLNPRAYSTKNFGVRFAAIVALTGIAFVLSTFNDVGRENSKPKEIHNTSVEDRRPAQSTWSDVSGFYMSDNHDLYSLASACAAFNFPVEDLGNDSNQGRTSNDFLLLVGNGKTHSLNGGPEICLDSDFLRLDDAVNGPSNVNAGPNTSSHFSSHQRGIKGSPLPRSTSDIESVHRADAESRCRKDYIFSFGTGLATFLVVVVMHGIFNRRKRRYTDTPKLESSFSGFASSNANAHLWVDYSNYPDDIASRSYIQVHFDIPSKDDLARIVASIPDADTDPAADSRSSRLDCAVAVSRRAFAALRFRILGYMSHVDEDQKERRDPQKMLDKKNTRSLALSKSDNAEETVFAEIQVACNSVCERNSSVAPASDFLDDEAEEVCIHDVDLSITSSDDFTAINVSIPSSYSSLSSVLSSTITASVSEEESGPQTAGSAVKFPSLNPKATPFVPEKHRREDRFEKLGTQINPVLLSRRQRYLEIVEFQPRGQILRRGSGNLAV